MVDFVSFLFLEGMCILTGGATDFCSADRNGVPDSQGQRAAGQAGLHRYMNAPREWEVRAFQLHHDRIFL